MSNYSFLVSVLDFTDKKLYVVVQYNDEDFLKYKMIYANSEKLKEISEENSIKDFHLENSFLRWEGKTQVMNGHIYNTLVNSEVPISSTSNAYVNLLDLARMDALYISTEALNKIKEEGSLPFDGTASFSRLEISESTMRVFLRVHTEEGWRTRSIIENDSGLRYIPLKFSVNSSIENEVTSRFKVTELHRYIHGVTEYIVYSMDDIGPLAPDFTPIFVLPEPMINYKLYHSRQMDFGLDFLKMFVRIAEEALYGPKEKLEKSHYPYATRDTDKSGVFFDQYKPESTKDSITKMLSFCLEASTQLRSGMWNLATFREKMQEKEFYPYERYAIQLLTPALLRAGGYDVDPNSDKRKQVELGRIQAVKDVITTTTLAALKLKLELFGLRCYMFTNVVQQLQGGREIIVSGGPTDYVTFIRSRGGVNADV